MACGVPTGSMVVKFILGVMEIESWFIAEHTHFARLHASLTTTNVVARVGFDPATEDLECRLNPAADLHNIYSIAGLAYNKTRGNCLRTIQHLDYSSIYCQLPDRFSDFQVLVDIFNQFLRLGN
jgi:hypothetical protein